MKKVKLFLLLLLCSSIFLSGCTSSCKASGCENNRVDGSKYCLDHICVESNCPNEKQGLYYCEAHFQCAINYCSDERILDSNYCVEHSKASTIDEIENVIDKLIGDYNAKSMAKNKSDFSEEIVIWGTPTYVDADDFKSSEAGAIFIGGFLVRELTDENKIVWEKIISNSGVDMLVPEIVVHPIIEFDLVYSMRMLILDGAILADGEKHFNSDDVRTKSVDSDTIGVMEDIGSISLYRYPDKLNETKDMQSIITSNNPLKIRLLASYSSINNIDFTFGEKESTAIREIFSIYLQLKDLCNKDVVYFGI